MQATIQTQTLSFRTARTYLLAAVFIAGNIVVPQLFHLVPQGGATWLPIYFFTLVGACLYGWRVGMLAALASPLVNSLLFGMPPVAALPAITLKSALLAAAAGLAVYRYGKVTLGLLFAVVLGYQVLGTLGEWAIKGDFYLACQDFRTGIPGMLLQIFGGRLVIGLLSRSRR